MPPTTEMEQAYLEQDAAYDGLFFLGVRTTGIFCRATCPARKPLPKHVEYFPTARAALVAGYRPCKRCRPLEVDDQPPWAADLLTEVERDPLSRITDGDLRARGIDPGTVRRHFLRRYGMTFQAFTRARRLSGALNQIREGGALDTAVFESGYDSHSGFRDAFARTFGDTPGRARFNPHPTFRPDAYPRQDSNPQPHGPKPCALSNCATGACDEYDYTTSRAVAQTPVFTQLECYRGADGSLN